MKNLRPMADRVFVKLPDAVKEVGGIHLPEGFQAPSSKQVIGEVVAVGPGVRDHNGRLIPIGVAVGDDVLLPQHGGLDYSRDGIQLKIYYSSEIVGIVTQ